MLQTHKQNISTNTNQYTDDLEYFYDMWICI